MMAPLTREWFQAAMAPRDDGLRALTPPASEPRSYGGLIAIIVLIGIALMVASQVMR